MREKERGRGRRVCSRFSLFHLDAILAPLIRDLISDTSLIGICLLPFSKIASSYTRMSRMDDGKGGGGERKENLEEFQCLVIGSNPELYSLSSIRFTCLFPYREMSFRRSNVEQRERPKRVPTTNKTDTRRQTLDSLLSLMKFRETFRPPFLYN